MLIIDGLIDNKINIRHEALLNFTAYFHKSTAQTECAGHVL